MAQNGWHGAPPARMMARTPSAHVGGAVGADAEGRTGRREVDRVSLYTKYRKQVTDALVRDDGLSVIEAQRAAQAWEFEANRRGLNSADPEFWRLGRKWMAAEREPAADPDGTGETAPGVTA